MPHLNAIQSAKKVFISQKYVCIGTYVCTCIYINTYARAIPIHNYTVLVRSTAWRKNKSSKFKFI